MVSGQNFWRVLAGAAALGTVCAVQPLSAQTSGVRLREGPDSIFDGVFLNPPARSKTTPRTQSSTVPVKMLLHPLREKPRRMLQKAQEAINTGNHEVAIGQLQEVLAKHPDAAYYAHSLLGFAYLKTEQFPLAVDSFEKALRIVPHDAVNHYDLGVSLLLGGNYKRGEKEVRLALELDPTNATAKALLYSLGQIKETGR